MLSLYNSLTRQKDVFRPLVPGEVRMYVCGMTVYDFCHVGHARVMVVFDMVTRWLRNSGMKVTYVRNITDIDDKIIKRATENGESIGELTGRFIAAMNEDADALGVIRPDHEPKATAYVAQMLDMIRTLETRGLAYAAANGDVYYRVRGFAGYGKLSGKDPDDLRAGERVQVGEAKEDPLDFVLWKAAKESEPAERNGHPIAYPTRKEGALGAGGGPPATPPLAMADGCVAARVPSTVPGALRGAEPPAPRKEGYFLRDRASRSAFASGWGSRARPRRAFRTTRARL
jgi:cysteinyl-tRNA synthetase